MLRNLSGFLIAALVLPALAFAQQDWRPREAPKRTVGLMGEVGVMNYNRGLNSDTDAGVGYGAHVDLSPIRNMGIEVGYAGGVNNMSDSLTSDGRLITNQVGGNLRINLVPPNRDLPANLRPFVFGGAFYHRIDTDNFTPGVADGINAFALPVGAGLEAEFANRFLLGGRFTYNNLFDETSGLGGRDADNWSATLNLGTRLGSGR